MVRIEIEEEIHFLLYKFLYCLNLKFFLMMFTLISLMIHFLKGPNLSVHLVVHVDVLFKVTLTLCCLSSSQPLGYEC